MCRIYAETWQNYEFVDQNREKQKQITYLSREGF